MADSVSKRLQFCLISCNQGLLPIRHVLLGDEIFCTDLDKNGSGLADGHLSGGVDGTVDGEGVVPVDADAADSVGLAPDDGAVTCQSIRRTP